MVIITHLTFTQYIHNFGLNPQSSLLALVLTKCLHHRRSFGASFRTSPLPFTSSNLLEGAARLAVDLHRAAAQALFAHTGVSLATRLVNICIVVFIILQTELVWLFFEVVLMAVMLYVHHRQVFYNVF